MFNKEIIIINYSVSHTISHRHQHHITTENKGNAMSHQVWVLGDAVIDLIPEDSVHYKKCPGGAPANVAVGIARLGGQSAFIGRVGADPFGRYLASVLQQELVDTSAMHFDRQYHTSTVLVDLDDEGERSFTFLVQPSADLMLVTDDLPTFKAGDWLHFCSIALLQDPSRATCFEAVERLHQAGGLFSFDPNIRQDLWHHENELKQQLERALVLADVVKLSEDELFFLTQQDHLETAVAQLKARYAIQLLIITLGADGVLVAFRDDLWRQATQRVRAIDTTGAGDAFVAGLLAGLAEHDKWPSRSDLEPIIQQAQHCGALATTALGAMTALPTRAQLDARLGTASI